MSYVVNNFVNNFFEKKSCVYKIKMYFCNVIKTIKYSPRAIGATRKPCIIMNLYELTCEQIEINRMLEENGGELTPELEEALLITEENLNQKAEGYCKAIAIYNGQAATLDEEIKRLTAKKKVAENAVARMKDALKATMNVLELDKINAGTFTISTRKSKSLEVLDEALIPEKYKETVTTIKVDKNAIKDAIKNGVNIDGVELRENKSIQIK